MEVIYFYERPKLDGYNFEPLYDYKYGVEFSFFDEDSCYIAYHKFLLPLFGTLIENYGVDPDRYEVVLEDEARMYRVYFKDESDQVGFKFFYDGPWNPDPVWNDE